MNVRRGEIFYIFRDPRDTYGTEQADGRPFIVISPDVITKNGHGALCVPLTTQDKKPLPQHCKIDCRGVISTALCEQIKYIDESKFGDYFLTLTDEEMEAVNKCLLEAVGLPSELLDQAGLADELAEAKREVKKLEGQLASRAPGPVTNSDKDAEIAGLKKEIEKLKIQAEAYINIIKS